ncbi:BCD family MFS transporter [Thiocapsa roseopersicina]|uniref:MFS transporter, BCD family, chlorophyll transporter n=1 Tax=Thiocapsa roseopersicina TaxID=1058 RepID=A0A1H2RLK1_THIRO|nr:BCD family MFS transporter [Thiocapsa roseopersicina]SDW20118.1 MFS transporter, BCD family, chlorophyll transporter [Thiocapsa roseopersicina]
MSRNDDPWAQAWRELLPRILPFSDVSSADFPLRRILRLSLFQVSVGMAMVLLQGTLNRVMVVELAVPASLVGLMLALPLVFAPLRALIGHRSDYHHSAFGLRRIPFIWLGSMMQFGGFAMMPFALLLLADVNNQFNVLGQFGAALAFLLVGAGLHTTQTAGLALATDLSPPEKRPRVVALLYVTLLAAWAGSSLLFGQMLTNFSNELLIQVIQGVALATIILNVVALWKQEAIDQQRAANPVPRPPFMETWRNFTRGGRASRLLVVVGLGTLGFTMQDILLEPYGGQILGLSVSQTTALNAIWAAGSLLAFVLAARLMGRGSEPYRIAAIGALIGILAFVAVILSAPLDATWLYRAGAGLIGFGGGLFMVATLTAAMALAEGGFSGLALGAWGAVQATAMGVAFAAGGILRDVVMGMANRGVFGEDLAWPGLGYDVVYALEILLLIGTLVVILPLVLRPGDANTRAGSKIGLDHMP